jgi:hypothetical protein
MLVKKDRLTRALVKTAVEKALRDLNSDPERTVRKAVDLALNFSQGRFQQQFFTCAQRMLENENSAYYRLARLLSTQVDLAHIKTFGVNLGYDGCTAGARSIRENEARLGCNIPWAITLRARQDADWIRTAASIVQQGRALGVHVYLLFGPEALDAAYLSLYERFSDCAFVLFVPAAAVLSCDLAAVSAAKNAMVCPGCPDDALLARACAAMREKRMLYSVWAPYETPDARSLLGAQRLAFYESLGGAFVLLQQRGYASDPANQALYQQIVEIRNAQRYAYFLADLRCDLVEIDRIISDDACYLALGPHGEACSPAGAFSEARFDAAQQPLTARLKSLCPKKPAAPV